MTEEIKDELRNQGADNDEELSGTENEIASAITRYVHCLVDAQEAALLFVPLAIKIHNKNLDEAKKDFDRGDVLAAEENDPQTQIRGVKLMSESFHRFERIENANVPETLEKALFLNIFSDFDTFTGDLLLNLYKKKPELIGSINKSIPLSDILSCDDFEELKNKVLTDELETFRRNSYVKQFEDLEKRFGVTLKKFDRWPEFVEATQRRNLFMHCNGILNEQYLDICRAHKVKGIENLKVGERLEFKGDYIFKVLDLMAEVSVKLGHVLWRKLLPDEAKSADNHLAEVMYNYLLDEEWHRVTHLSDFALRLVQSETEEAKRINIINSAIAYKFSGKEDASAEILSGLDWSATSNDFKLAVAVLRSEFDEAASIMLRIGKASELVVESAYHEWPLFREFRESEEFLRSYEEVYGYSFVSELKRSTEERKLEAEEEKEPGAKPSLL
jgi:hypothetical protein